MYDAHMHIIDHVHTNIYVAFKMSKSKPIYGIAGSIAFIYTGLIKTLLRNAL